MKNPAILAHNLLLVNEAEKIAAAMKSAAVDCLFLKGIAMLRSGAARADERTMSDVDILVRPADKAKARVVLEGLGYELKADDTSSFFRFADSTVLTAAADLHDSLWHCAAETLFAEAVIRGGLKIPCPEDMAVHILAHSLLHRGCLSERAKNDFLAVSALPSFNADKFMARARFCGVGALAAEAAKQTGLGNFPSGGFIKNFLARAACKRTVPWPLMEYLLPVAFAPKTALGRLWPPTGELREAYGGAGFTARLRRICLVLSNCAGSFFRRSR